MRTILAVLLTVVVTVPLTTRAQQETPCAWVVWVKQTFFTLNGPPESWEVRVAVPNHTECLQIRQRLWKFYRESPSAPNVAKVTGVEDVLVTTEYKNGGSSAVELFCLPSMLDPRAKR
jgi:hypothetical protein